MTPRQRIAAAVARRGPAAFAAGCAAILRGEEPDPELLAELRGEAGGDGYWYRVWAARGLRWAWHDSGLPGLLFALADEHWRVREMACKVVAHNLVEDAFEEVTVLRGDAHWRVRAAAERAVVRLSSAPGHAPTGG